MTMDMQTEGQKYESGYVGLQPRPLTKGRL